MKRLPILLCAAAATIGTLISCDDDSKIGSSVAEDQITVTVDSSFTVTGHSRKIGKVQSRTVSQLFGRIDAKGYGRLSSDVVTQFMPAGNIDGDNIQVENIDSMKLIMTVVGDEFIGDSIVPLGLDIYKLDRQLPSPIYSDFNPEDYYSPQNLLASKIYNMSPNTKGSSVEYSNSTGVKYLDISVDLPVSLGQELYSKYLENPASFSSPTAFADVFPGLYLKNSFGSGRVTRVQRTLMSLYYHYNTTNTSTGRDTTIVGTGNYFAVTPEIITNNNVSMTVSPEIEKRVNDGENIVMGPVGLEVKMRFPAPEIIAAYRAEDNPVKVLNTISFSVPCEYIENDFNIQPPQYLLMVLEKDKDEFFANNNLPDSKTSFYATYSSTLGVYSFGDMRTFINELLEKEDLKEEDYTFVLTPVSAVFETVQNGYYSTTDVLSMMTPYMASPVMGKLDLDNAKIKLTFTSQTISK